MRICFVSRRMFPAISGMSTYAWNLVRHLRGMGHDLSVIAQYRGREHKNVYRDGPPQPIPGVTISGFEQIGEQSGGDFERDIYELRDAIVAEHRTSPFDVIHAQFAYPPGLAALLAAQQIERPVVLSVQGGDGHWFGLCCPYHAAVKRLILEYSDAVIVGTNSFALEIHENTGMDAPFLIIPGAVDPDLFRPASVEVREAFRASLGIAETETVVLYHGRIDWRKGLGELLDAFRKLLKEDRTRALLLISGVGPDEDRLHREIADGLSERCRYLGYVRYEDSPSVYNCADLFCSPTHGEGCPNTLLEAMGCGVPVLSTRVTGVLDLVEEEVNGILVDASNPDQLAREMERLEADLPLRRALAEQARKRVVSEFNWKHIAARLACVYGEVQSRPRASAHCPPLPPLDAVECRFRASPHLL